MVAIVIDVRGPPLMLPPNMSSVPMERKQLHVVLPSCAGGTPGHYSWDVPFPPKGLIVEVEVPLLLATNPLLVMMMMMVMV